MKLESDEFEMDRGEQVRQIDGIKISRSGKENEKRHWDKEEEVCARRGTFHHVPQ